MQKKIASKIRQYLGFHQIIKKKNKHFKTIGNQILYVRVPIVFTNFESKKIDNLSLKSKNLFPANFFDDLVKFNKLKMQKKTKQKTKNKCV